MRPRGVSPEPRASGDFALRGMTIRKLQRQRCVAWMAVLAIVLLSVVPTVSQIILRHAPHVHAQTLAAGHVHHPGHAPAGGSPDDDCWSKCGYCDFLAHTPALATIAHVPAFAGAAAAAPLLRAASEPHAAKPLRIAQPRGPPAFLA
jgi:hypothetical protein